MQDEDLISQIAAALSQSRVYVDPNIKGIDSDTVTRQLRSYLNSDDHIVLVVLDSSTGDQLGMQPLAVVQAISEEMGNNRIIGLAMGRQTLGYAAYLNADTVDSLMQNATGISNNNPISALVNFVGYMHAWLADNPEPTPLPTPTPIRPPTPQSSDSPTGSEGSGFPWWPVIPISGIVVTGVAVAIRFRTRQIRTVPTAVQELLTAIEQKRLQIEDQELSQQLAKLPIDTARYFKSYLSNREGDFHVFQERLAEADTILDKYVDIQDSPRYYPERTALLEEGKAGINDLCATVLQAAIDGSTADLASYKTNATILQEYRRLADPDYDFEKRLES